MNRLVVCWLIWFLLGNFLLPKPCHSQSQRSWGNYDPECLFLSLNDNWTDQDENKWSLPVVPDPAVNSLTLQKYFFLPDSLPEELVLWIGRYSWEMEIMLNGRYLTVVEQPFHHWYSPLSDSLLVPGQNHLTLILNKRLGQPFGPVPVMGLWDGIGLVEADRLADILPEPLPEGNFSLDETVALIAPYYGRHGYAFDELEAMKMLFPLAKRKNSIKRAFFWFEPDRELLALCRILGIHRVRELQEGQQVSALNAYPFDPSSHGKNYRFWRDLNGDRTSYYGETERWNQQHSQNLNTADKTWIVVWVLIPILALALIKLVSPTYFLFMASFWVPGGGRNDSSGESIFSSNALNLILNILRILGKTSFIGMGLYFLIHQNLWYLTSYIFSEHGLFAYFFTGDEGVFLLISKVLSAVVIWQGIKFLLWGFIGWIFGIKQMAARGFALEVLSSMPYILFLGLLWIMGLYTVNTEGFSLVMMIITLAGIYAIRKLFVLFSEMNRVFSFSSGMKILYICTFNVLPYLIWL